MSAGTIERASEASPEAARRPRPAVRAKVDRTAPVTDRDVRIFGVVQIVGFGLIGAFLHWRGATTAPLVLWGIGGTLGLLAIALPGAARPVRAGWMRVAGVLGHINTTIILAIVYYLVLTPTGLFLRLLGRDALRLRGFKQGGQATYWEPKAPPAGPKSYFSQF